MFDPRLQVDVPHPGQTATQLRRFQNYTKQPISNTWRENFHQYLFNTTLHGLKYIGDRTISRLERLYFALMFVIVFIASIYFISNVWVKWNASPLIISLGTLATSVKSIPFPAVTICNMNQARKSAVLEIPLESEEYAVLQSICQYRIDDNLTNIMTGTWEEYRQVLVKVAHPCQQMLVACFYGEVKYNCSDIFNTVLTDAGLCCSFNGLHRKFMLNYKYDQFKNVKQNDYLEEMANNWTPETGFASEELEENGGYPRPGLGSGQHLGLTVVLMAEINEYYCTSTNGLGFKVILHSPHELPEIDHYGLGIANGFEARIIAEPIISKASKAVRKIPVDVRQCLFESENFLKFYRTYSRRNCQSECEMNIYLDNCGCILYYMPRPHPNLTICGFSQTDCVINVDYQLRLGKNKSFHCECPYGCHAIKYGMSLSASTMINSAPLMTHSNLSVNDSSVLHIYYQSTYYRSQNKEELIGFTDFLSNIGGLLGLFMGFSVFSIIEIIYFLSIRPYCNYLKNGDKRRKTLQQTFAKLARVRQFKVQETKNSTTDNTVATNNRIFPKIN